MTPNNAPSTPANDASPRPAYPAKPAVANARKPGLYRQRLAEAIAASPPCESELRIVRQWS